MAAVLLIMFDKGKFKELSTILKSQNHKVIGTDSIAIAKKYLNDNYEIELVILCSTAMKDKDFDLLDYIKQTQRYKWIPVIVACEACQSGAVKADIEHGADDIISYPFNPETVKAKFDKALANGKRTILVVDDEQGILDVLERTLEIERFKVLTAETAESGLELLANHRVHAIISDIVLPGLSGLDLLTKSKELYKDIPVILITGFSGKFTPENAIAAGGDGYFKKPFHNLELVNTLRQILQKYYSRETLSCKA